MEQHCDKSFVKLHKWWVGDFDNIIRMYFIKNYQSMLNANCILKQFQLWKFNVKHTKQI